jgi:hypothetical protein
MELRRLLPPALALCLALGHGLARADEPDAAEATLHITATSVAVGVGYSWGKGALEYQGKTSTVTLSGLSVIAVGVSSISATGRVTHLTSLDQFGGNYNAVPGGSTLGEGGAGVAMRNQEGVEVRLVAETTGVTLTLGKAGVNLAIEK